MKNIPSSFNATLLESNAARSCDSTDSTDLTDKTDSTD